MSQAGKRRMSDQKRCVFIINRMSGRGDNADADKLSTDLGEGFACDFLYLTENTDFDDLTAYDRVVACGGDGTLNGLLNSKIKLDAEMFYMPCGTLNETADAMRKRNMSRMAKVGKVDGRYFSYVCAAGSFTPLGYRADARSKKKFKFFAYLKYVLAEYKIWDIQARVSFDGREVDGPFTLIMAINSPTCFRFKFNRLYDPAGDSMHLLLIKAPRHRGLFGKIQMFFPFFRAFFVGFKKPYDKKNMLFLPIKSLSLRLKNPTDFNFDGELISLDGDMDISCTAPPFDITIVQQKN